MHTQAVRTKTYGVIRVHYNSDWSGEVIITCNEQDINLPGEVLLAICEMLRLNKEFKQSQDYYKKL